MVDGWMGDDWFHNGAFRIGTLDFAVSQSTDKAEGSGISRGHGDDYSYYLQAGSMGDFARHAGHRALSGRPQVLENPAYTEFWSVQAVDKWLAARPLTVPTLIEVGQWDQEDSYGGPAVYKALKAKYEDNDLVHLAIGPWRHSGANHYGYDLGALTSPAIRRANGGEVREAVLRPLSEGRARPQTPPVLTYATGINQWQESPRWPMGTQTPLYLGGDGNAGFDARRRPGTTITSATRPSRCRSFRARSTWATRAVEAWLVHDQRFVTDRPDVLSYTTAPLTKPVHIMGAPQVELFAATSGTDSDWVVKLIDVYPNDVPEGAAQGAKPDMAGYRAADRDRDLPRPLCRQLRQAAALQRQKVEHYQLGLPNVNHVFLPGHRIMVQVQSSLFPLYDRNPQSFVPNIFYAKPGDYRKATQSVYRGGATARR